jgi:hypothetical protein
LEENSGQYPLCMLLVPRRRLLAAGGGVNLARVGLGRVVVTPRGAPAPRPASHKVREGAVER